MTRFLDGAFDGGVVAFALWTVAYEVALAGRWSLWTPVAVWLVAAVLLVVGGGWWGLRGGQSGQPEDPRDVGPETTQTPRPARLILLVIALAVLAVTVAKRESIGTWPAVVVAIAVLVEGLRVLVNRTASATVPVAAPAAGWQCWGALGACLGLGVLGALLLRPDADDVFYVNRSVWVAEHGVPALRDTIFGPETFESVYGGGIPLASIEALYGALAHLLDVRAGTVSYLLAVPLLSFAAGWATWRLVRAWAPRRRLLVFALALAVLLLAADSVAGNYGVGRIWQGKVTAFAVLSPLIWVHLSRLASAPGRTRTPYAVVMLFCSGIAFVGLTASASMLAPVYAGAALLAALLLRLRELALGALALAIAPVVAGVANLLGPHEIAEGDAPVRTAVDAFRLMLGIETPLVFVGLVAVCLAVRMVPGPAAVLASCGSLAALSGLMPGAIDLVDAVAGAAPVAWRLMTVVPVAVLVGLLAALRPRTAPWAGVAVAAAVAVLLAVWGRPLWVDEGTLVDRPGWKTDPAVLEDVREVSRIRTGPGLWLLPPEQMEVLPTYTVERFAVVPRLFYLSALEEPDEARRARLVLYRFAAGATPRPAVLRSSMDELDVALACVRGDETDAVEILDRLAGAPVRAVGSMACTVVKPPGP